MIKSMRSRPAQSGFTLIQISILLTVAALVLVNLLPTSQLTLKANASSATQMNVVLTALRNYEVNTGTLPCPADPTQPLGSTTYGVMAANGGTTSNCTGGTPAAAYADATNHIAIGMVPVRSLGLASGFALDGYGRDITYAVDTSATGCWPSATLPGAITINDNGTTNHAVAMLVSHGADGYGAWLPLAGSSGTAKRLNSGSTNTYEA